MPILSLILSLDNATYWYEIYLVPERVLLLVYIYVCVITLPGPQGMAGCCCVVKALLIVT